MKTMLMLVGAIFALLLVLPVAAAAVRALRNRSRTYFANIAEGTHEDSFTKLTDAAITTRGYLYKRGSDDSHIAVLAATSDVPLGVVDDEASAAELPVAVQLLGKGGTKKMVCNEAMTIGDEVYTTASGKVQDRPAGAGTYWKVGIALTATSADGDIVEVLDHPPIQLVIP